MNATQLRADLYKVLDSVLETGKPITIERKGRKLRLMAEPKKARPRRRKWPRPDQSLVIGNLDDIWKIDWSREWKP